MNRSERLSIRRILVALDASLHSTAALETAAELAGRLGAELIGLFVEDINLVRVAELPFAREVSLFLPTLRQLELQQLERQFRVQANRMRQALAAVAERENVPWEFRVVRGAVASELLAAGADADLVILGKIGRSLAGGRRVGSTVQMIVSQGRSVTLILQHGSRLAFPVILIHDGSELAKKALDMAAHLAETRDDGLVVFIIGDALESAQDLQSKVVIELRTHNLKADFHLLIHPSLSRLAYLVQMEGSGPVVLPCGGDLLRTEGLCDLVNEIPNPILLVR